MLIAEVDIDISIRGPIFIRKISDFKTRKIKVYPGVIQSENYYKTS